LEDGAKFAEPWNFAPNPADAVPVRAVIERIAQLWGDGATWTGDDSEKPA
jgi:CDP-glucose 4,6-dehydratase